MSKGGGGGKDPSETITYEVVQSDLLRFHLKQGDCATIAVPDPDLEIRRGGRGGGRADSQNNFLGPLGLSFV